MIWNFNDIGIPKMFLRPILSSRVQSHCHLTGCWYDKLCRYQSYIYIYIYILYNIFTHLLSIFKERASGATYKVYLTESLHLSQFHNILFQLKTFWYYHSYVLTLKMDVDAKSLMKPLRDVVQYLQKLNFLLCHIFLVILESGS